MPKGRAGSARPERQTLPTHGLTSYVALIVKVAVAAYEPV